VRLLQNETIAHNSSDNSLSVYLDASEALINKIVLLGYKTQQNKITKSLVYKGGFVLACHDGPNSDAVNPWCNKRKKPINKSTCVPQKDIIEMHMSG